MAKDILIYAVDDEESIRELYSYILQNASYKVKCFINYSDLFVAIKEEVPDLFILDIMLDDVNGLDILQILKKNPRYASVPVIMVSALGAEMDKVKGLNLGADDYIAKPFGVLEFLARVNAKLRTSQKNSNQNSYKDITIDNDAHIAYINGVSIPLAMKEYSLLTMLIENNGKALSRELLLRNVWGFDACFETRTLDMHIAELRKKLKDSICEIETIRGIGYKLI